jgi:hypothetical protein
VQSRLSRLVRGWIAGSFATGIAALSHGIVDGGAPSPLALGVGLVFAGVLGTLAIGRRPSLPRLTVVVAGAQVAFHVVFSSFTPGVAAGSSHHAGAAVLQSAAAHHGTDPWMWAAHATALVATLLFLRRAELALWGLLTRVVLDAVEIARRLPAIARRRPIVPAPSATAPRHPVLSFLKFVVSHRGPPRATAAP